VSFKGLGGGGTVDPQGENQGIVKGKAVLSEVGEKGRKVFRRELSGGDAEGVRLLVQEKKGELFQSEE